MAFYCKNRRRFNVSLNLVICNSPAYTPALRGMHVLAVMMLVRSAARKIRRGARPLCGWLSIATYLLVASGLPICISAAGKKNLSQPFPCMNCACGCHDAEQCWRSCCCHTLAERLAWARENHVQPPDYALAEARTQGIGVCDDHQASHACCCCCAEPKAQTPKTDNSIVLIQSLKCSGLASDWLGIGIATIPIHSDWQFQLTPCEFVERPTLDVISPAFEPLLPPPRVTIA
jgi:hypothetical protein